MCHVIHRSTPKRFFGVLCMDSDIDGYFTREKWDETRSLIYPYVRLIIFADQLTEVLVPITLEIAARDHNDGKDAPSIQEAVEPSAKKSADPEP